MDKNYFPVIIVMLVPFVTVGLIVVVNSLIYGIREIWKEFRSERISEHHE